MKLINLTANVGDGITIRNDVLNECDECGRDVGRSVVIGKANLCADCLKKAVALIDAPASMPESGEEAGRE